MAKVKPLKKIKLHGFNNLTKHLSFNLYDVCYAKTPTQVKNYLSYIDEEYNAERWHDILVNCTRIIGANILNTAKQDYEPQGASVTMLISEEPIEAEVLDDGELVGDAELEAQAGLAPPMVGDHTTEVMVNHLDKSHICVHTYPEHHPDNGICTFRADVEISTCGKISPLHALNYLLEQFEPDVLNIDYRVRGFTRDVHGNKHWIDHRISSIQDYISRKLLRLYNAIDVNVYQENLFHSKLMWKKVDLDRYLFGGKDAVKSLAKEERVHIRKQLKKEIEEIFYARNLR